MRTLAACLAQERGRLERTSTRTHFFYVRHFDRDPKTAAQHGRALLEQAGLQPYDPVATLANGSLVAVVHGITWRQGEDFFATMEEVRGFKEDGFPYPDFALAELVVQDEEILNGSLVELAESFLEDCRDVAPGESFVVGTVADPDGEDACDRARREAAGRMALIERYEEPGLRVHPDESRVSVEERAFLLS